MRIQAALDNADAPIVVFFRNDDAGWDDAQLFRLLRVFCDEGIAVDLAAIPTAITALQARRLCRVMNDAHCVRVHQHGYSHQNHEPTGRSSEFGPTRPATRQWADIRSGKDRLRDLFDGAVDAVFTPPWNRCTQATVEALNGEGFRILSCDRSAAALAAGSLDEVPVSVDWQKPRRSGGAAFDAIAAVANLIAANAATLGVMTHHCTITDAQLRDLGALLKTLGSHPRVRFDSLGAMAQRRSGCSPGGHL